MRAVTLRTLRNQLRKRVQHFAAREHTRFSERPRGIEIVVAAVERAG